MFYTAQNLKNDEILVFLFMQILAASRSSQLSLDFEGRYMKIQVGLYLQLQPTRSLSILSMQSMQCTICTDAG